MQNVRTILDLVAGQSHMRSTTIGYRHLEKCTYEVEETRIVLNSPKTVESFEPFSRKQDEV